MTPGVIVPIRRNSEDTEKDPYYLLKLFSGFAGAMAIGFGYKQVFPEGTNKIPFQEYFLIFSR